MTALSQQQRSLGSIPDSAPEDLRLQIVIEPFGEAIVGLTLSVENELLIGRSRDAGLVIAGHIVSRRHVLVRAAPNGLEIEDVSVHGTLVDGTTLRGATRTVAHECALLVGCTRLWLRRVLQHGSTTIAFGAFSAASRERRA